MEQYAIAALIIATIVIIFILARAFRATSDAQHCAAATYICEGAATYDNCGHASEIELRANPLLRYDFLAGVDSSNFGDIKLVSALAGRPTELAEECNATPGCVAFNTHGWMKSGLLPPESRQHHDIAGFGTYARKCIKSEPLYAQIWIEKNYGGTRYLVPPGEYSDVRKISTIVGGGTIPNDKIRSMKIPVGLKVEIYCDTNFGSSTTTLTRGDHPDIAQYKTGKGSGHFGDCISSIKILHDAY
jgi:hypothetical protein